MIILDSIISFDSELIKEKTVDFLASYGPKLIGAIIVLIVGLWIVKLILRGLLKYLDKSKVDDSLKPFFKSLLSIILKLSLFIAVLGMLGIEMTSFIAIMGAAGLAIGLALSGTLQNFAGGVIILLIKPFKVGDFITAQGHSGTVNGIHIFNTILLTPDKKTIIIPNGGLSTNSMINYSAEEQRRVEWTFGVAYGEDIDIVKETIKELIEKDERILKDPEPFIAVSELADSSVNFVVRAWANAPDFWNVNFDMNENIYKTFNNKGISIPFPQMDVHINK